MAIENIIIGTPLVSEESLGISPTEESVRFSIDEMKNEKGDLFLPHILKTVGLFKSTSEIRKINDQRMKSEKFNKDPDQSLWRTITHPEMTNFKIGKRVFWLIIGE